MSGAAPVQFGRDGAIANLTLNRPEAGNSIDLDLAQALVDAVSRCERDDSIRCVTLTGAGRMFCGGGDVGLFASQAGQTSTILSELANVLHIAMTKLARMNKPLLVLVNGPVAGAGLSLAAVGDIVLAARSAHFTAAYTAIGLTPDGGLTWLLPRLIGLRKAQEMILTNRRIGAEEAEAIGIVTRVIDDAALAEEGAETAAMLSRAATGAIGTVRSLLLDAPCFGLESQLEKEARAIAAAGGGSEAREGIMAYLEKRKPDFEGL